MHLWTGTCGSYVDVSQRAREAGEVAENEREDAGRCSRCGVNGSGSDKCENTHHGEEQDSKWR